MIQHHTWGVHVYAWNVIEMFENKTCSWSILPWSINCVLPINSHSSLQSVPPAIYYNHWDNTGQSKLSLVCQICNSYISDSQNKHGLTSAKEKVFYFILHTTDYVVSIAPMLRDITTKFVQQFPISLNRRDSIRQKPRWQPSTHWTQKKMWDTASLHQHMSDMSVMLIFTKTNTGEVCLYSCMDVLRPKSHPLLKRGMVMIMAILKLAGTSASEGEWLMICMIEG